MFILYGSRWYFRRNKTKTYAICEHCESFAKLNSYTASNFGHLYFVPLIPLKMNRRVHCLCSSCKMMVEYHSADHDSAVQSVLQQAAEVITAMLDGETHFRGESDEISASSSHESLSNESHMHDATMDEGGAALQVDSAVETNVQHETDDDPGIECLPLMDYLIRFLHASGRYPEIAKLIGQFESADHAFSRSVLTAIGHELQGKFDAALMSWEYASQHPDSTYYADQRYSALLSYRRRHDEAAQILKRAIAREVSTDVDLSLKLSLIDELRNGKRFEEAVAVFDEVFAIAPQLKSNEQLMKLYKHSRKKAKLP